MKTLVIHDASGKVVFTTRNNSLEDVELTPLVITVPEGKMLIGVNIETGEPIFADIPPSEVKVLNDKLDSAVIELTTLIAMGGM